MSSWHVDDGALEAYVARRLEPLPRSSVEAHLMSCQICRDALRDVAGGSAGTLRFDRLWDRVQTRVEHQAAARTTRRLRRLGVAEPDTVVLRAIASQSLQWTIATTLVLAVAALAAVLGVDESSRLGFVLLAPLLPPLGVAATFRLTPTSTALLEQASPYSPARLLFWRTGYVLATAVPASIGLGAIIPGDGWLAFAWLLPSAACTAIVLAAATWTDPLVPALTVSGVWVVVVTAWYVRDLPDAVSTPATQVATLVVAVAAGATFARRLVVLGVRTV
jgi:hypothetical protein